MTTININSGIYTKPAHDLVTKGYRWVTVKSRGENKGDVISKHRTYDLASRAARNTDRTIVDLGSLTNVGAHK